MSPSSRTDPMRRRSSPPPPSTMSRVSRAANARGSCARAVAVSASVSGAAASRAEASRAASASSIPVSAGSSQGSGSAAHCARRKAFHARRGSAARRPAAAAANVVASRPASRALAGWVRRKPSTRAAVIRESALTGPFSSAIHSGRVATAVTGSARCSPGKARMEVTQSRHGQGAGDPQAEPPPASSRPSLRGG